MLLELYGIIFWLCAMAFTAFRSKSETRNILATILKMIPAISAAVFVLLSDSTLFYLLLAAALIFCSLGDAGMEINILPGLGLFLISHFIYTG
ncbi:MAG: lysoplasmalogenase family protein, partial [Candidatus Thorarchaeota archaeon]